MTLTRTERMVAAYEKRPLKRTKPGQLMMTKAPSMKIAEMLIEAGWKLEQVTQAVSFSASLPQYVLTKVHPE